MDVANWWLTCFLFFSLQVYHTLDRCHILYVSGWLQEGERNLQGSWGTVSSAKPYWETANLTSTSVPTLADYLTLLQESLLKTSYFKTVQKERWLSSTYNEVLLSPRSLPSQGTSYGALAITQVNDTLTSAENKNTNKYGIEDFLVVLILTLSPFIAVIFKCYVLKVWE